MDAPEYQEYKAEAFPIVVTPEYSVKVVIGCYAYASSPIVDDITNVTYFDIQVKAGKYFEQELPAVNNSFLYVFEGSGELNGQNISSHTLITLGSEHVTHTFIAGEQGARFILVSGKPIKESVVQYGPFVMNTKDEVDEAMRDYQSNTFIRDRARINRNKKAEV